MTAGYITDANGERLRVEESSIGNGWTHRFKIYIPGAYDADRTIIIRYRVANAIRFYFAKDNQPAFDELYWNVTGTAGHADRQRARACRTSRRRRSHAHRGLHRGSRDRGPPTRTSEAERQPGRLHPPAAPSSTMRE